jgi:hypothetical protein
LADHQDKKGISDFVDDLSYWLEANALGAGEQGFFTGKCRDRIKCIALIRTVSCVLGAERGS